MPHTNITSKFRAYSSFQYNAIVLAAAHVGTAQSSHTLPWASGV